MLILLCHLLRQGLSCHQMDVIFCQIASRLSVSCDAVQNVIIWGNHSSTQFPDAAHASVDINGKKENVGAAVKNDDWLNGEFIKVILSFFSLNE